MAREVLSNDDMKEFAKRWVPSIIEAALDLHRAGFQYKHNQDAHIEAILEHVAKLQMERMCVLLRQFVWEYQIHIGVDADADVLEPGTDGSYEAKAGTDDAADDADESASESGTDDAPATSLAESAETPDNIESYNAEMLVGLS